MIDFSHLPNKNNIDVQSFFSGAANNTVPNIISVNDTYMTFFDGNGDYLTTPASAFVRLNTGDFTVECWFCATAAFNADVGLVNITNTAAVNTTTSLALYITAADQLSFFVSGNGAVVTGPTVIPFRWYHVALVRSGSTNTLYLNGVPVATSAVTPTWGATPSIGVGRIYNDNALYSFNGYISNVRIVKGTAVYTSKFTPSTDPLTAVANTIFLTCQAPTIIDSSSNNYTITSTGVDKNNVTEPDTIFNDNSYKIGFNGTTDYLTTTANNAAFALGTTFTVEAWIYPTASVGTIFNAGALQIGYNNTADWGIAENIVAWRLTSSIMPRLNYWNHIAVVRTGTGTDQTKLYLNGTNIATGTYAPALITTTVSAYIGTSTASPVPTSFFQGFISNLRVITGQALYSQGFFTPSTTPLVAIANTSVLTCQSSTIVDNSLNNLTITTNGNAAAVALNPFGNSYDYSISLDGSGDYLSVANNAALNLAGATGVTAPFTGAPNFTIECWFYCTGLTATDQNIINKDGVASTSFTQYAFRVSSTGVLKLILGHGENAATGDGAEQVFTIANSITLNTWYHVAACQDNLDQIYTFLNGTLVSTTTRTQYMADGGRPLLIGYQTNMASSYYFRGYVSNVRIIKGTALYTTNFTPSTKPLTKTSVGAGTEALTGTVQLLTCQDSTIIDNSSNNFTFKTIGSVTISPLKTIWPVLATDMPNWHTWIKPRGVNWVYMIGVGGGASGVGGTYNAAINSALAQPGGAGGGSGAQTVMMLPAALLPPTLYVHLGQGGRQTQAASASLSVPGGPTYVAIEPLTIGIANNSQLLLLTANGATGTTGGAATTIADNPLAGRAIRVTNTAGQSGTAGAATGAANGISLILPATGLMVTGGTGGGGKSINYTVTSQGGNIAGLPTATSTANTNMHVGYIPTANGGVASITNLANGGPGQAGYKFSNWLHLGGTGGGGGGTANTGLGSLGGAGGDGAPGCGGGGSGSGGISTGLPGAGGDGFVHIISF